PKVHVRLHDWSSRTVLDGIRNGRLQLGLITRSPKAGALRDVQYEELFRQRVCVAVAPRHPFARCRAIPLSEVAAEPLVGLTREDYPNYYDLLSIIFSKGNRNRASSKKMTACPASSPPSQRGAGLPLR